MGGGVETEGARQGGRDPDHPEGMHIGKRCAYRPVSTLNTPSRQGSLERLSGRKNGIAWKRELGGSRRLFQSYR